jgi:hypothetical protein
MNDDAERIAIETARTWSPRGRAIKDHVKQIRVRAASRNGELGVTVDAQGRAAEVRLIP